MTIATIANGEAGSSVRASLNANFADLDGRVTGLSGTGLVTAANIAALQAITPTAGELVRVEGYATPGDGGGGMFRADLSGALETDGGLVFGATADESTEQTVSGIAVESYIGGFALPHTDLSFGSVVIDPDSGSIPWTMTSWDLHGHRLNTSGNGLFPLVDHKAGTIAADGQQRIDNGINTYGGGTTTSVIRYKHLGANARRWVRVTPDAQILDVRWFGVVADGTDQRNRLCWALNAAKRLGYIEVRLNGEFRYLGALEIPNGVDFGWGKLTVVDTLALEHLRTDYATAYPGGRVIDVLNGLTCICPEDNSTAWGLRSLELDGNYQNNTAPLEDVSAYALLSGVVDNLQNTPTWAGFSTNNHGGRIPGYPQQGVMEDVHIHGFGSNCYLGHGNTQVSGRNVRLGNSARNHLFYSIHGVIENLTCYGFAWGAYGKSEHCDFVGLNYLDLTDFDFTPDGWGQAPQLLAFEGMRRGPGDLLTGGQADRWRHVGINIKGGLWDLKEFLGGGALIYGSGQHLNVDGIRIMGPLSGVGGASSVRLVAESVLGSETELYEGWTFKNITIMQRGIPLTWSDGFDFKSGTAVLQDYSVQDLRGYEGAAANSTLLTTAIANAPRTGPNAGSSLIRRVVIDRVRMIHPTFNLIKVDVTDASATPVDIVIRDSLLRLATNTIIRTENGTGTIAGMTIQDLTKHRVYMEGCQFTLGADTNWSNPELFFALTTFSRCQTVDGKVSEQSGTFTASGGESSADISTNLLWAPRIVQVFLSNTTVTGVSVALRDSGNTGTLGSVADRRSPIIRVSWTGTLSASDTIQWRTAVGGPTDGTFVLT